MRSANDSIWDNLDERYLWGLLIILFGVGIFVTEFFEQSGWSWAVRFVVLVVGIVVIYVLWNMGKPREDDFGNFGQEEVSTIRSVLSDEEKLPFSAEDKEFDFYEGIGQFFDNLIKIVHASFAAHSAIIFLWNENLKGLQVEFCQSESDLIQSGDQVDVNGTLPGSVSVNKTSVLEQNIPAGQQSVRYYRKPVEIRSFLGVPLSIRGDVKGVVAIDSLVANDFSDDDLDLLHSYEKLISQGIELISEREKSRLIQKSVSAQQTFVAELDQDFSPEGLLSGLAKASRGVCDFDRLTISTVDVKDADHGVRRKVIGQRDGMGEGFRFPLADGLSGWVIRRNKPLLLGDLEKGDLFRPRYTRDDKSNYGLRSFMGVPITFQNQVFGLISLENKQPDYYTDWDQSILIILAKNFGMAYQAVSRPQAEA
ncbi:MAG: GAF domain-containing protein [bacterium]